MKVIMLPDGRGTIVDDEDYSRFHSYPWRCSDGYVRCTWEGQALSLHRLIMSAPAGMEVHHRDEDPLNNTRANLELLSVPEHRAAHRGPLRPKRRGPAPVDTVRVWEEPFDWLVVDRDYMTRGL